MLHKSDRQLFNLKIKTAKKDAARKGIYATNSGGKSESKTDSINTCDISQIEIKGKFSSVIPFFAEERLTELN